MKTNQKKCTLYLEVSNGTGSIEYTIDPVPTTIEIKNQQLVYNFLVDINQLTTIKIQVIKRTGIDSYIMVKRVDIGACKIQDLNAISFLRTENNKIKKNHGYIDCVGEFIIKIHTNIVSLNYLTYLLSLTK